MDDLSTGFIENIEFLQDLATQKKSGFRFIKGDIRDLQTCTEACRDIDYVLHHAALGSVPRSIKDPLLTHQVNVDGFLNILLAAREAQVKRVVYASSSSVYGNADQIPNQEGKESACLSPYAVSKKINELYAANFSHVYGLI
ncbi:GDP-mannose 4,6-dehydratase [Bdellovibrionota bacterium FG-1]